MKHKWSNDLEKLAFCATQIPPMIRRLYLPDIDLANAMQLALKYKTVLKNYLEVSDCPIVHSDYCVYCDGDHTHTENCKYFIARNTAEQLTVKLQAANPTPKGG